MTALRALVVMLLSFVTLVACSIGSDDGDTLRLRVVHIGSGLGMVDFEASLVESDADDPQLRYDGIGYLEHTGYSEIESIFSPLKLSVQQPGTGEELASLQEVLLGDLYTVVVGGSRASPTLWLVIDENRDLERDAALLRGVHAVPGGPEIDLYLGSSPEDLSRVAPVSELAYQEASSYQVVEPGQYFLLVTVAGSAEILYQSEPIELSATQKIGAVVYPSGRSGLEVLLIEE